MRMIRNKEILSPLPAGFWQTWFRKGAGRATKAWTKMGGGEKKGTGIQEKIRDRQGATALGDPVATKVEARRRPSWGGQALEWMENSKQ